jgi:hypothetical protein
MLARFKDVIYMTELGDYSPERLASIVDSAVELLRKFLVEEFEQGDTRIEIEYSFGKQE